MTANRSGRSSKDVPLEALRGLSAVVVVLWHCCLAFAPRYSGLDPHYAADSLRGNPLFVFINGEAAVSLFFVLSGFVLTRRYFAEGDPAFLLKGALKRWPRLLGPVMVTVLVSFGLFALGLYQYEAAGKLSGSLWLAQFAGAFRGTIPQVTLMSALKQGAVSVFFRGDDWFDTSLWTMRPELIGSFVAFGISPLFLEAKKTSYWIVIALGCFMALMAHFASPSLVAFIMGTVMAALVPRRLILSRWAAYCLLIAAIYLLGYAREPSGAYSVFAGLPPLYSYHTYPNVAGAAILICLVEFYPPMRARLSGSVSRWLGEFSFPVYLLHVLVICSLGSTVYVHHNATAAVIGVLVATPFLAFPLLLFNRGWVSAVNHVSATILARRTTGGPTTDYAESGQLPDTVHERPSRAAPASVA